MHLWCQYLQGETRWTKTNKGGLFHGTNPLSHPPDRMVGSPVRPRKIIRYKVRHWWLLRTVCYYNVTMSYLVSNYLACLTGEPTILSGGWLSGLVPWKIPPLFVLVYLVSPWRYWHYRCIQAHTTLCKKKKIILSLIILWWLLRTVCYYNVTKDYISDLGKQMHSI